MCPLAKECQDCCSPRSCDRQDGAFPEPWEGACPADTLISDSGPAKVRENGFLLFLATWAAVIHQGRPTRPAQWM